MTRLPPVVQNEVIEALSKVYSESLTYRVSLETLAAAAEKLTAILKENNGASRR